MFRPTTDRVIGGWRRLLARTWDCEMKAEPGRNSPCPCGSGRKYKHCCLGQPEIAGVLPPREGARPTQASSDSAYEQALRYRVLGLQPEAVEACRAAIRQNPNQAAALRMLGEIASESGRTVEALELFTRAIRAQPRNPAGYAELGRLQLALKRPAEAIAVLRRALEIDPGLVGVQSTLGIALKELGQLDEADRAYREALELDPRCALAHQGLGELFHYRGELEGARLSFETALEIDPRLVQARIGLGNTLLDLGEFQVAVDEYRRAIAPGHATAAIHINLGAALKELGDAEGSLRAFQQAVAVNPRSWEAHLSLASGYLEFGRFAESIGSVREAIRLGADLPVVHLVYGTALGASGDFEGAIDRVRQGLPPESTLKQIQAVLAGKLLGIGLNERALQCFTKQLDCDPDDVGARHFIAALSGQNPNHPSEDYVRELFDQFAETFDHQLVAALGYSVPRDIVDALLAANTRAPPWDVLDLGCGTGLVGREIVPHVRSLVGVDLSSKMIDRARACNAYAKLKVGDLNSALDAELSAHYDVVTAADVFLYVGKLDAIVPAVRRILRSVGMFAFSAEAMKPAVNPASDDGAEGYLLMPTGRYAHAEAYLRALASRNEFEIKLWRKVRLRTEHRRPVWGWITIWASR